MIHESFGIVANGCERVQTGDMKKLLKVWEFLNDGDRIVVAEVGAEWASRRALENLGKI